MRRNTKSTETKITRQPLTIAASPFLFFTAISVEDHWIKHHHWSVGCAAQDLRKISEGEKDGKDFYKAWQGLWLGRFQEYKKKWKKRTNCGHSSGLTSWDKNAKSRKKTGKRTTIIFVLLIYDGRRAETRQKPGPPPSLRRCCPTKNNIFRWEDSFSVPLQIKKTAITQFSVRLCCIWPHRKQAQSGSIWKSD